MLSFKINFHLSYSIAEHNMANKQATLPLDKFIIAGVTFHKDDGELAQYLSYKRPKAKTREVLTTFDIPLNKAMRGSITLTRDPESKDRTRLLQKISFYRKNATKKSARIYSTRYASVSISKTRATVTFSFPLCDDPDRLIARMQNFGNIIIDESDEIAAMLNQEGATKIQEAWQEIEMFNLQNATQDEE